MESFKIQNENSEVLLLHCRWGRCAAAVRGGGGGVPGDHDASRHGNQAAARSPAAEGAAGVGPKSW